MTFLASAIQVYHKNGLFRELLPPCQHTPVTAWKAYKYSLFVSLLREVH